MLVAETRHLIQLDVSVGRFRHGRASDPPVGARQPCRQIGAGSSPPMQLAAAGMRNYFAVTWLPEPDQAPVLAEHDSVVPPPDNGVLSAVGRSSDGYEVTG
jgi:hypothetical protein